MKKLYSIDTQLYKVTGVEKVMLDIHLAVKDEFDAKIVGNISYDKVYKDLDIQEYEYVRFKNPFMFYNSIVIVHERRLLIFFWLLNCIFFQKIRVVYVHHNILHNHVRLSKLPKTIVAIANKGIENLINEFKVPRKNIHKIFNCVVDKFDGILKDYDSKDIRLLMPGRINGQKQQTEIVKKLRGKLDKRVHITFIGEGPQLDELRLLCEGDSQFEVLGYRNNVHELIQFSDYVFLYSVHEGLPITLIEATMMGTPIICSEVGGNPEICWAGKNGWVLNDWDLLIQTLNNLPNVSIDEYRLMCNESRKIYEENFTFERFQKSYLDLLKKI